MPRKIIKGTPPQPAKVQSASDPFAGVNPDAFSTETDRTRTRAPFKETQAWNIDELDNIYSEQAGTGRREDEPSLFRSLGLAIFVFVIVAGIGTYYFSSSDLFSRFGWAFDWPAKSVKASEGSVMTENALPEPPASARPIYAEQQPLAPREEMSVSDDNASILDKTDTFRAFDAHTSGSIGEFISKSTVNGVFMKGKKSRITLNGKTFRVGDTVSSDLELIFLGFHKNRETAVFQGPDKLYYQMPIR